MWIIEAGGGGVLLGGKTISYPLSTKPIWNFFLKRISLGVNSVGGGESLSLWCHLFPLYQGVVCTMLRHCYGIMKTNNNITPSWNRCHTMETPMPSHAYHQWLQASKREEIRTTVFWRIPFYWLLFFIFTKFCLNLDGCVSKALETFYIDCAHLDFQSRLNWCLSHAVSWMLEHERMKFFLGIANEVHLKGL